VIRRPLAAATIAAVSTAALVWAGNHSAPRPDDGYITGPYADLLASSTDLGPARGRRVQLTAALRQSQRPELLQDWSAGRGLSVRWRDGDQWAVVEGSADAVSAAFGIDVHDYRGRRGQLFYASPQQPAVPNSVAAEVAELGRVLSFTPHRESRPPMVPTEVPEQGLSPGAVVKTYNIAPLRDAGYTGKGATVVVFACRRSLPRSSAVCRPTAAARPPWISKWHTR
jgi:kumamolisin